MSPPLVQLGFVDVDDVQEPLLVQEFPTKLGGLPFWLDPSRPLAAEKLTCGTCSEPMILLLQMYTAEDFPEEAYHRDLYLFVCRNGKCHRRDYRKCTRVFRAQLPLENDYFATDPDSEATTLKPAYTSKAARTCAICGVAATKRCGKCQSDRAHYCSRSHQAIDWTYGSHSATCGKSGSDLSEPPATRLPRLLKQRFRYPELSIVSEPEEMGDGVTPGSLVKLPKAPVEDEDYEESETGVDRAFLKFQKRIERYPDQVLRYLRVSDEVDPVPLYVSDDGRPLVGDVAACPRCGTARTLECQVLSTLLVHLPLDETDSQSYDFGTYFVYTCPDNCELKGEYAEEVVFRQDFSADGMAPAGQRFDRVRGGLEEHGYNVDSGPATEPVPATESESESETEPSTETDDK